jgi:2-polyprenyl-6-methoxyphenol hydroxylase-like FAD-dependent oxidoreductase
MRVGVVGFGVAGAAASSLLAQAGHDVTLFEREPELRVAGAGVLLQPSGQLVLERLGVLERVRDHAAQIDELLALAPSGRTVGRLRYGDLDPGLHALGVHRSDLLGALADLVGRSKVDVRFAEAVAGPNDERLRDFDLIVGADGSRSALRSGSGLVRWEHEYAWGALWAIGSGSAVRSRLHQVVRGTGLLVGVLPLGEDRFNIFWSVRRDRVDALRARGFEAWRQEVSGLCPEAAGPLASLGGWEDVRFTTYRHALLRRPHSGRMVLIGDAAHPMSPHLGQGINLALTDAWLLAESVAASTSPADAVSRYAISRRRQIAYYGAVTLALTPFFQSDGRIKGWGRDAVLPYLPLVPGFKRRMLRTLAGLVTLGASDLSDDLSRLGR